MGWSHHFHCASSSHVLRSLGKFDLAAERASLIETVRRAFVHSNLGKKFAVQLLEWHDHESVRDLTSADNPEDRQPMPPLLDLDVVIVVVWHDLGAPLPAPLGAESELADWPCWSVT